MVCCVMVRLEIADDWRVGLTRFVEFACVLCVNADVLDLLFAQTLGELITDPAKRCRGSVRCEEDQSGFVVCSVYAEYGVAMLCV